MIALNTKVEEEAQIKTQYDEFDDEMQSAINYYQSECIEKEIKNDI